MNWAGLGWLGPDWQKGQAADGTDCTRQALHHSLGGSLHCPAGPADLGIQQAQPGFPQPVQPVLTGCS